MRLRHLSMEAEMRLGHLFAAGLAQHVEGKTQDTQSSPKLEPAADNIRLDCDHYRH